MNEGTWIHRWSAYYRDQLSCVNRNVFGESTVDAEADRIKDGGQGRGGMSQNAWYCIPYSVKLTNNDALHVGTKPNNNM